MGQGTNLNETLAALRKNDERRLDELGHAVLAIVHVEYAGTAKLDDLSAIEYWAFVLLWRAKLLNINRWGDGEFIYFLTNKGQAMCVDEHALFKLVAAALASGDKRLPPPFQPLHKLLATTSAEEGAQPGPLSDDHAAAEQVTDDTAYVAASSLWPDKFDNYKQVKSWLKKHSSEIRTKKPTSNRLEIHAGDWLKYWQQEAKARDEALDQAAAAYEETERLKQEAERLKKETRKDQEVD